MLTELSVTHGIGKVMPMISIKRLLNEPSNNPFRAYHMTKSEIRRCTDVKDFLNEKKRNNSYDCGRVQYFIRQLREGKPLEPIRVIISKNPKYAKDTPLLVNGFHRLAAYIMIGRKMVPVKELDPF